MNIANQKQQGAVLILALVMLMVLTLIGVQSMSGSAVELSAASNAQQHNIAFQGAQSRLAFVASPNTVVNPINYLIPIDVDDPPSWPVQTCDPADGCPNGTNWSATATVSYIDCGTGIGSSLEEGKGFAFRMFEVEAVGVAGSTTANSTQINAIRYPVKGCG